MSKTKYWLTLLALGMCGGSIYIIPYIRYVFYTQMMEIMQCTNTQLASLNSVYAIIASCLFVPGGILADKVNAKKLLLFSLAGTTLLTVWFAMMPSLMTARLVWIGLAVTTGTTFWPAFIKFINALGDEESSGRTFGYYYALNGISAAIINSIALWSSTRFGFRTSVMIIAAGTAVATVMVVLVLKDEGKTNAEKVKNPDDEFKFADVGVVLKNPMTYVFAFIGISTYRIYSDVSYFTPYLVDVLGVSPESSGVYSIIRTYVFMLLAPIGGFMCDKVFKTTSRWLICSLSIIAALIIGIMLIPDSVGVTFVSIYTLIPAAFAMAMYGVRFSIIRELHFRPAIIGTVMGVSSMISWLGDFVFPPIYGTLLDKYGSNGYVYLFSIVVAVGIMGVLLSLLTLIRHKRYMTGKTAA